MAKREQGFTLIEVVISIVIVSIAMTAISTLFVSNVATVSLGKARTLALAVATQQVEYLRDLPYDSLATQHGPILPQGTIPDDQNVTSGSYRFRVHTVIDYIDDPYDGLSPTDLYSYDYKIAEVSVFLKNNNKQVATLSTYVAAKAAETATNTGILSIKVIDANGNPVSGATLHITDPNPSPAVDITTVTDSSGLFVIPKLPLDSTKGYQITASLTGYSTDMTKPDPVGAQTPVNPNVNILAQQITPVTLSIDRVSTMNLHVVDTSGNPMTNFAVTTTGSKKYYTTPDVFKYSQATNTDGSDNITLPNMEWDSYSFSLPAGYYLVSSSPYAPVSLSPNSSASVTLTVSNSSSYPRITSVSPLTGTIGTNPLAITITGANLSGGSALIRTAGQSDINFTGVTTTSTSIGGSLNLTNPISGSWDIVVTAGGHTVTQPGGFNVSN